MLEYAAVLGHQPNLSIAELAASVPGFDLQRTIAKSVAVFRSSEPLPEDFIDTLGGTLFLAESVSEDVLSLEDIPQVLVNETSSVKKKVTFSLRCFGMSPKTVGSLFRDCKRRFKDLDRPCRYVGNEKKPAIAALLHDADIVGGKKGCELLLIAEADDLWIGRTVGAQDVDEYTHRDTEKPVRDTTVGLLPPKLAQVLINFGGWLVRDSKDLVPEAKAPKRKKKEVYTILDPFCGTGVIPMECMLRGWHVLASDAAQKAVNGCKKNIEWVRKDYEILKKDVSCDIQKHDATKPFSLKELPDVVVTETTLGPPLSKRPSASEVKKLVKESEALQIAFLKNAAETLPGVPLVCTWPVWKTKDALVHLEAVMDAVHELGYSPVMPAGVEPTSASRLSVVYRRKDQFVGREIVLLKAKK